MLAGLSSESGAIAELEIFEGVSAAALRDVMATVRIRALPRGKAVFDQGEHIERAHALLAGAVRISQGGSDGGQIVIRFIGPGEIFGAVAIYTDRRYPADAVAMVDSVEASWGQRDLFALVERYPRIGINMLGVVGRRLADLQDRVRELATQRVDRRIAHTLLRLLRQFGQPTKDGTTLSLPLRRKDIADIAGTRLHSVSRVLAEWERSGLIRSSNLQLTVFSVAGIEQIAES